MLDDVAKEGILKRKIYVCSCIVLFEISVIYRKVFCALYFYIQGVTVKMHRTVALSNLPQNINCSIKKNKGLIRQRNGARSQKYFREIVIIIMDNFALRVFSIYCMTEELRSEAS